MLPMYLNYRTLENNLENQDKFIEILSTMLLEKGVTETTIILKSTGVLINPYPGKHKYRNLIKKIDNAFQKFSQEDIKLWTLYKNQSEIFNSLFQICYQEESYLTAVCLFRNIEIQTFLAVLEISLTTLKHDTPMPIKLNFEFAFTNYDSVAMAKERMFNYIANIAGSILNYLVYHKKPQIWNTDIDSHEIITNENLINSSHHFSAYDKINVLNDMVDYWRYNDCTMNQKNKTINFEPKLKEVYLANDISLKRFETRREKLNIELEYLDFSKHVINHRTNQLPPKQFVSKDEIATYYNCKQYFYLETLDQVILDVPFKEWIRAYSVLKIISNDFIKQRDFSQELKLSTVCLLLNKQQIESHFYEFGISIGNMQKIIDRLTYGSKDTDLFDTPIINFKENEYIIMPSLAINTDIARVLMCNFLKKKSNMDFKGTGFENQVLKELSEKGIKCSGLYAKGKLVGDSEERPFQCDVAFILNEDLYLCECKSFSQPTTHRGFYNLIGKKQDTTNDQFKKIADFYKLNIDIVRAKLNLPHSWNPRKIYKFILVSTPLGSREKIGDTFVIDYSAFSTFLQRNKPSIVDIEGKTRYEFNFYSILNGDISSEKMLKLFKNPPQVDMEKKRRRRIFKQTPFGDYTLVAFDFQTRFDDKISLKDKNLNKYLNKFSKTYFKNQRM
jgi:hypothetical protein